LISSIKTLREIADRFISEFETEKVRLVLKGKKKKAKVLHRDLEEEVYALLLRRSCTFEQTWQGLSTDPESLRPVLEKLLAEGKIEEIGSKNREYYRAK
jgi:wyosine [tRNA(Phe)-imidazoG37] synthetase (radical SAM superfamily)